MFDKKSLTDGLGNISYSPESAVADIVDNCLDAKAKNIDIKFWSGTEVHIAIIDDGLGMSHDELDNAIKMKKGVKSDDSLGKFGWGLKTATFSQAKELTIITKKKGNPVSFVSLDSDFNHIETNLLKIFKRFKNLEQWFNKRVSSNGTAIVWSELRNDILGINLLKDKKRPHGVFYEVGTKVTEYTSMCFHNFLDKTNIYFNDKLIQKKDPFKNIIGLKKYPEEKIEINNSKIIIGGVLFPKEDDMDNDDLYNELGLLDGWHASQGIYIYRENRLIKWGGWCDLTKNGRDRWRSEEKFKRCRVYLKYESDLDSEFRPNVQKTKSIIPHYLRHKIAEYCEEIRNESSKVVRKKQNNEAILNNKNTEISLIQIKEGNNIFINHAHPLIKEFLEKNMGKTKKEYLLDKILSDIRKEKKENKSFIRKLFSE